MAGSATLGLALGLEALLLAAMVLALFCAAARRSLRRRRHAPAIARGQAAIRALLAGDAVSQAQRTELRALPIAVRIGLLADPAAVLHGEGRDRLTAFAGDLGLLDWAEERCASRRWHRRLRGVRLFIVVGGGTGCVPALLCDDNREVRAAAASWSGDHPDRPCVERVLDLLSDDEPLVRFATKNALLRIGRETVAPLADRLSRLNGREREREREGALEVAIGLAEPRLAAPALAFVCDDSPRVRSLAATLAAAIGGVDAVATVEGLLDDPAAEVRAAAVEALGKLGHWPSGPAIAVALRDPAWEVRRQAALALRALGAPGLLLLRRTLTDEDRYARDIARQVLDLPAAPTNAPRSAAQVPA